METDYFHYIVPRRGGTWISCKEDCESIPGHRLGMFQSLEQFNTLLEIDQEIGINMRIDLECTDGVLLWGDGTNFSSTPAASVANLASNLNYFQGSVKIYNGYLRKTDPGTNIRCICQGNPLNRN
ncbi:hypothetical protein SK128_017400, partial [Halocaridina rubra]